MLSDELFKTKARIEVSNKRRGLPVDGRIFPVGAKSSDQGCCSLTTGSRSRSSGWGRHAGAVAGEAVFANDRPHAGGLPGANNAALIRSAIT